MPDYIYLLENRLAADQRNALNKLRDAARDAGMILFLTGDAVRDLTSGHAVRELEVAVHGNALKLKKPLEKGGAKVWGEDEASRSLYLCFPGTVRVDVVSTHSVEYPKPGKAVYHPASIQEDLRRRDFTVNAMAISLNEGSFGLLMDPLNGVADIEQRTLRLVSNYGFLEDPSLLIRATRYKVRLGWELDPRTQARYENAKTEGVIDSLSPQSRSRELEQIGHEEEGLKVLQALTSEGWMKALFPAWTPGKADEAKLKLLHDLAVELLMQGVHSDMSAAQMQLLTAAMPSKDLASLKKLLLRPGFVEEWNSLDALASGFQKVLLAKQNVPPSASYKLFLSHDPEAVLWLGFTSKNAAVQERYRLFVKSWPQARQRIPYALMQEMRITPDLPGYDDLVQAIFLELIDGKLATPEEMRAYLEPHSPPAPPPQPTYKRSRARRAEIRAKDLDEEDENEDAAGEEKDDLDEEEEEIDTETASDESEAGEDEQEREEDSGGETKPLIAKGRKRETAKKVDLASAKPISVKPSAKGEIKPAKKAEAKPADKVEPQPAKKIEPRPTKQVAAKSRTAAGKAASRPSGPIQKSKTAASTPRVRPVPAKAGSTPARRKPSPAAKGRSVKVKHAPLARKHAPARITGKDGKPAKASKSSAKASKAASKSAAKPPAVKAKARTT